MAKQLHFTNHKDRKNHILQVAKDLNLDVKNVSFFRGHDGMTGINADIYFNNKKFAHAYDDARGGEMEITITGNATTSRSILLHVNEKLSKLPKYKVTFSEDINGKPIAGNPLEYETSVDLSDIVDYVAEEKERIRLINRDKKKAILYVTPEGEDMQWGWKESIPAVLKKFPTKALESLQKAYDDLKKEGNKIINVDYLKEIGVNI